MDEPLVTTVSDASRHSPSAPHQSKLTVNRPRIQEIQLAIKLPSSAQPPFRHTARAVAPHVQAAVAAIAQRRVAEPPRGQTRAPHVQAALQASGHKPAAPAVQPKAVAVQPRLAAPPVVQRAVVLAERALESAGYLGAATKLLGAARADRRLRRVIEYAEDERNNADLELRLGRPGSLALTDFTVGGTPIGSESDLEAYVRNRGAENLATDRMVIRITVDADKLLSERNRDVLQTFTHEYAIHAMKYPAFLIELRRRAAARESITEYARREYREGSMSGRNHHTGLVEQNDEDYNQARTLLLAESSGTEQARFLASEREDIHVYREIHSTRSVEDERAFDQTRDRISALNSSTPLLFKKPKPAKTTDDSGCCFLTTACVEARNLPLDCHELTTLRAFRDETMQALPNGPAMISRYSEIAPHVVGWIKEQSDAPDLFESIYLHVIQPTVALIEAGETAAAIDLYGSAVEWLSSAFLAAQPDC